MAIEKSDIEWTDYTWNPFQGCHKVSEGCKVCYMFRDKERYGQNPNVVVRSSKATFNKPLSIKEPSLIFTCSWSDFFIEEADRWRDECWDIIKKTPQHTYQILTKRPERILFHTPLTKLDNVWIGTSIESNKHYDRVKHLIPLKCTRFISFEPLLERIEWRYNYGEVDWIIIGAESGYETGKYKFRDCNIEWIIDLANKASKDNVKVFVKQVRINGKLISNPILFPEELKRFREYPERVK
jgi:protein gp37